MNEDKIDIPALEVSANFDYLWSLKSTIGDRGAVLLALAAEWAGNGSEPLSRELAADYAAEMINDLLGVLGEKFGHKIALEVIKDGIDRYLRWE